MFHVSDTLLNSLAYYYLYEPILSCLHTSNKLGKYNTDNIQPAMNKNNKKTRREHKLRKYSSTNMLSQYLYSYVMYNEDGFTEDEIQNI